MCVCVRVHLCIVVGEDFILSCCFWQRPDKLDDSASKKQGASPALLPSRHSEGSSVCLRHLRGLMDGQSYAFENKNV